MHSCWDHTPTSRPSFTDLKGTLGKLISMSTDNAYIDLMAVDNAAAAAYYISDSLEDILGEIGTDEEVLQ